jgi:integrase
MARKKLTDQFVKNIHQTGRRKEYCDLLLQGFGLRVTKSGVKTFYVRVHHRNKTVRITLGKYPALSLADARIIAQEKMRMAIDGSLSQQEAQKMTVKEAHDRFIELYAKIKNKDWRVSASRLKRFMTEYGGVYLSDIHRRDVNNYLDKIMSRGTHIQANRAHSALSRFMNWCVERTYIEISPCHGVKKPAKENPRDRVLGDQELKKIYSACDDEAYPFGPLFKLLLLTAQRRGEVSDMRWCELDLKNKIWTIPKERAKNGKAHMVQLSEEAITILESMPRFLYSDLVFTTNGRTAVSGHDKVRRRMVVKTGVEHWRIHDFRRTAASGMARLGVTPYVVEKILNHVSGTFAGVLGVYNQYGYDQEKRDALNKWANHLTYLQTNEEINIPRNKPEESRRSF